jgi:hypothetical protein
MANYLAHLGVLVVEGSKDGLDAFGQPVVVLAQLRGESVARVQGRGTAEDTLQGRVVGHESHDARPSGEAVEGLHQGHTDHGPDGVAGASGPAGRLQVGDQGGDLRGGQEVRESFCVTALL